MAINQPEEDDVVEISADDPNDSILKSTFLLCLIGFGLANWIKNVIFVMWHTIIYGNKNISHAMSIELAVGIVVAIYATCFWCDWCSYKEDSCSDDDSLVVNITVYSMQGMFWGMMAGGLSIPILILYGLYKLFLSIFS